MPDEFRADVDLAWKSQRFPGSFADHVAFRHGPRGPLGRYMLAAETYLAERDIVLRRVEPGAMVELNRKSESSWWRQVPVLDAEAYPPRGDELIGYIGYDARGKAVTAVSIRLVDLGSETLKAEMESLRFFGPNAHEMQRNIEFQITSPLASQLRGPIVYVGGFWVHPDSRGTGISAVVPKVALYAAIATWGAPIVLSIVKDRFLRPDVVATYEVEGAEPYFSYKTNGRILWDGALVWFGRNYLEARLDQEIARVLGSLSVRDGRRQHALRAVDVGREQKP